MSDVSHNTTSPVLLHNTRMTEATYDAERARLRELYGNSSIEAAAKRDQALAVLFHRSGWTQDELAAKEGKSPQQIARQLRFGRFRASSTGEKPDLPNNFTERRFRSFWERTTGNTNERARFSDVIKLMQNDKPRRAPLSPALAKNFGNGEWFTPEDAAVELKTDPEHVVKALQNMKDQKLSGIAKVERKPFGKTQKFRLFKAARMISSTELTAQLSPILNGLEAEGKKSMATMSPTAVAVLAHKLRQLLKEWTE